MVKELYCICRTGKSDGFMVSCDRCDEWFHGGCIELTQKAAKDIDKWYCGACLDIEPTLSIVYLPSRSIETAKKEKVAKAQDKLSQGNVVTEKNSSAKSFKDKIAKDKQNTVCKVVSIEDDYQERVQQENIPGEYPKRRGRNSGRHHPGSNLKKKGPNLRSIQCENPPCSNETRKNSNYCSDECGLKLAQERLKRHFLPKWEKIKKTPAQTQLRYEDEIRNLEIAKVEHNDKVMELVRSLRKLEEDIETIKECVSKGKADKEDDDMETDEEEDDDKNDESEEVISAEVTKTFCVTCGMTILSDNAFKHWTNCYKKLEGSFSVTTDRECTFGPPDDRHPPIFCENRNERTNMYCKRFRGFCVEHPDKDLKEGTKKDVNEICGCPLNIQQELKLDGQYCQEKKSECTSHYLWAKFRKAQLNQARLYHYYKLEETDEKLRVCRNILEDYYGGIVGLMLHTTRDERSQPANVIDLDFQEVDDNIAV